MYKHEISCLQKLCINVHILNVLCTLKGASRQVHIMLHF